MFPTLSVIPVGIRLHFTYLEGKGSSIHVCPRVGKTRRTPRSVRRTAEQEIGEPQHDSKEPRGLRRTARQKQDRENHKNQLPPRSCRVRCGGAHTDTHTPPGVRAL